ncbi:MAG: hypothetical protein M1594_01900 [Candidatus Marsarchaeota archaeon]|nr:hypothetical protein [Candidatus Marsarchaeota archaeon]
MKNFWKGFFVVVGVLLFFIILFWLFNGGFDFLFGFLGLTQRIQSYNVSSAINNEVSNFNSTFGQRMINYTDFTNGFTVSYPKGYIAGTVNSTILSVDNNTQFLAYAGVTGWFPEVLSVDVLNGTASDLYNSALYSLPGQVGNLKAIGKINSFYELSFDFSFNSTTYTYNNETVFGKQAYFDCKNPLGSPYVAIITFLTPDITISDLSLADYIFSTFKC